MKVRVPITRFAPAERVPIEIIRRQAGGFQNWPLPSDWRESPFQYIFVLNRQRQIVFTNRNVQELASGKGPREAVGMRLGEALDCVRAAETEGGCGTTESCQACGATAAILSGLAGRPDLRRCRLTRSVGCRVVARDFMAMALPFVYNCETFCFLGLSDSGEPEVKHAIEQFFFRHQRTGPG